MNVVKVENNQSLLDIAIQVTGIPENFLRIAMANDLVPTEPIQPGTELIIPEGLETNNAVIKYYTDNEILPASALNKTIEELTSRTCEEKLYDHFRD